VDGLVSGNRVSHTFELGGHEFVGRTDHPTQKSMGRLPRLVAMLKANPEVVGIKIHLAMRTLIKRCLYFRTVLTASFNIVRIRSRRSLRRLSDTLNESNVSRSTCSKKAQ
jgi:hypothetical protein